MTSEEIKDSINRLRVLEDKDIAVVLTGEYGWTDAKLRSYLIALLEQADPDTHMELPKDADGEYIDIGDELISNHSKKTFVVTRLQYSRKHAWMVGGADKDDLSKYGLYAPRETRHYHKPTIESVLYECCSEYHDAMLMGTCDIPCDVPSLSEVINKYAEKLRDVMQDE